MESLPCSPISSNENIVQETSRCINNSNHENTENSPEDFKSVLSFDACRLLEVNEESPVKCEICLEKNRSVITTLSCCKCNISCCPKCYDEHRQNRFLSSLRTFQEKYPVQLKIKSCGELVEVLPKEASNEFNINENMEINTVADSDENSFQPNFFPNSEYCSAVLSISNVLNVENLKQALTWLKETYSAIPEIVVDEFGNFKCLYFQDSYMKDYFNFYPNRICIDVTCTISSLSLVLYLILCEDSNGQSEIISVAFLNTEDSETLIWLLNMFKKHNPSWRKIKMLIVDSMIRNREILKNAFPGTYIKICLFHSARTFKSDLCKEFLALTENDKTNIVNLFEKMALVYGEHEYNLLYQQLLSTYGFIREYFDKNWHSTRNEWRIKVEFCENVLCAMNEFVSFIDKSLKPVILLVKHDLCELIDKIFIISKFLRLEKNHKNSCMFQPVLPLYSKFTPHYHISNILTPYAAELVIHHLDMSAEIGIHATVLLDNYAFTRNGVSVVANSSSCTCKFFTLTSLFCCHIFAVRRVLSLPAFDESQCDFYWTQKYFQNCHNCLKESSSQHINSTDCPLSVIDKILPVILKDEHLFQERISLLSQLVLYWKKGQELYLQFNGKELSSGETKGLVMEKPSTPIASCSNVNEASTSTVIEYFHFPKRKQSERPYTMPPCEEVKEPKPSFLSINHWFGPHLFERNYINFIYLSEVICKTKESCIKWLQHMGFLPNSMQCPACNKSMKHENVNKLADGVVWICTSTRRNKKSCSKRCTVRRGTWMEHTNMSLEQILYFAYMWINFFPSHQIIFELGISAATFTVWDKYFRRVCGRRFMQNEVSNLSNNDILNDWLQTKQDQDTFVAFLSDASAMHNEDQSNQ